jgi:predicted alpha/beta-hydrolase family hydrolase
VTTSEAQSFFDNTPGEAPVRGYLHRATHAGRGFLVLTHGAGGNCNAPLLVALATKFAASGLTVLRCDLPYRQRRPHGAPSPSDAKTDQAGLRRAVELMKKQFAGRAFLGGSSYGGRQASMLVTEEPSLVEGLLLLSYPLRPPGRPGQLRTAHFPGLRTLTLFVSGTRDAFGSIEELQAAIKLIPARKKLVAIAGAPHGLSQKSKSDEVPEIVVREFETFFADASRRET